MFVCINKKLTGVITIEGNEVRLSSISKRIKVKHELVYLNKRLSTKDENFDDNLLLKIQRLISKLEDEIYKCSDFIYSSVSDKIGDFLRINNNGYTNLLFNHNDVVEIFTNENGRKIALLTYKY